MKYLKLVIYIFLAADKREAGNFSFLYSLTGYESKRTRFPDACLCYSFLLISLYFPC